ncbi:MAG TPA: hypothetical protein VM734_30355, partial [Kofleriaceae bacterium]|nr:hypothetical protein [Kofleriaceae bacterium]
MSSSIGWVLAGVTAALMTGCFKSPSPECSFACDPAGAALCPDDYTCRPDGLCKREGVADDFSCPNVDRDETDATVADAAMIDAPMID